MAFRHHEIIPNAASWSITILYGAGYLPETQSKVSFRAWPRFGYEDGEPNPWFAFRSQQQLPAGSELFCPLVNRWPHIGCPDYRVTSNPAY